MLGKGGVAIVWLAISPQGQEVALKQFPKANAKAELNSSAQVEIEIANSIFRSSDQITSDEFPGLNHIAQLLTLVEDK